MIAVTPTISIDENEIALDFVRASGPGGQNVNKVSTAAQLRFDVKHSPSLPEEVRIRLMLLAGNRVTADGVLVITAQQFRTQTQNRQDALDQLVTLVQRAAERPKPHIATKPTRASKVRRLDSKRRHSENKQRRREPINY
jgi:ribosome-associated protein